MQEIKAERFAVLPEDLRITDRKPAWGAANKPGQSVPSFLEGPCFGPDGALWCVDIPWGRIFSVDASGTWRLRAGYDGWPNGMRREPGGGMLIADYRNGVMALDPESGRVVSRLATHRSEGFKGLNDLFIARDGTLYVTDQGQTGLHDPTGRVWRLSADGRLEALIRNAPSPNGLVTDLSEGALYVAMTRSAEIWRVPLFADGTSKVGLFARVPAGRSGPDGLALDEAGTLYVAHASHGMVYAYDEDGHPTLTVDCRAFGKTVTNLAFGGPERRQLYVTVSDTGTIAVAEMPIPGRAPAA